MHTYVFGLLCLALSCSPQASAESQAAAEMEFAAEQVLEQADALFRKMPAEDQLVSHLLKLSELFSKTKQPELAESRLAEARKKTLEDNSRSGQSHKKLMHFYSSRGDLENAYEIAHDFPKLSRSFISKQMMQAELKYGNWDKAVRYFNRSFQDEQERNSQFDSTSRRLRIASFIVACHESEKFEQAMELVDSKIQDADEVIGIKSYVWRRLASKAWNDKDEKEAVRRLDKAIALMRQVESLSSDAGYYLLLLNRAAWTGNLNSATIEQISEEAVAKLKDTSSFQMGLASWLGSIGELDLMAAVAEKFEGNERQSTSLRQTLAHYYAMNGEIEKTLLEVESIPKRRDRRASYLAIASGFFDKREYRKAIKFIDIVKKDLENRLEDSQSEYSRKRELMGHNRIKYLANSLLQRKILIPDSVNEEERLNHLIDLTEILIDSTE